MKYIVLGDDAKEYGPIDAETLRKWVENGRVLPHTQVRNALLKNKWGDAEKIDFLHDAFAVLGEKRHEEATPVDRFREVLFSIAGGKKKEKTKLSTFRRAYVPQPAPVPLRMMAWIFDMILLGALGVVFLAVFWSAEKSGHAANPTFHFLAAVFTACALLYYGIALGIYAQTVGMWFWGIMLAKRGDEPDDVEEVYLLRAYGFTLAMTLFGVLSPLALFLPRQRTLHDLFTGCVVIRIAAKPKA
jgi:uncharacterized RDD family membrane protein YckC